MSGKPRGKIGIVAAVIATACLSFLIPVNGQTPSPDKGKTPDKGDTKVAAASTKSSWTPPRTPDGQPDIQGVYARAGIYGLAPQELEANGPHGKENPLDDDAFSNPPEGRSNRRGPRVRDEAQPQGENGRSVPLAGPAPGPRLLGLVDPPDKILPWKPEEDKKRREFLLHTSPAAALRYVEFDARCALPGLFLNGGPFEFIQTAKQVVILSEYQHYTRTIHLDGRPHLGAGIRLFMGDSIGHWVGNTLIVDTTNFNEFTSFTREIPYLSDALHTVERFTIADENNIDYEVTIEDPKLFSKPWKTAGLYRKAKKGYEIMEYGCAEGSLTLENIFGKPPGK
jgi:hypothetical protein